MSDTHPSIPAVVTLPERSCEKCREPLLMHATACSFCGKECPRGGSEPTPDELREELEIERAREASEHEYSDGELAARWPGSYGR